MWHVVSIDDLAEVSELLEISLHHPDITLHQAATGPKGLALIRDLKPNLVILDLMLPGMSGWDVYDAIRTDEALAHIPVIILSVLSEKTIRHPTFGQEEIDCYVAKPFDIQPLRKHVMRMMQAPALWS